jgi:hypothetical protein
LLLITDVQRGLMRGAAWDAFSEEMVEHLHQFAPQHCRVIGRPRVRRVVDHGIGRAKQYGFTNRGPLRFYLEMMVLFGSDFDTDPQCPAWLPEILNHGDTGDQMYRAELIHRELGEYYEQVVGPRSVFVFRSLERTLDFSRGPLPYSDDQLEPGLLRVLQGLYPEKFACVGADAHRALITHSLRVADERQVKDAWGRTTLCILMTMAGHSVVHDLLYPWVRVPLEDHVAPARRGPRLKRRVGIYLENILKNLGGPRG